MKQALASKVLSFGLAIVVTFMIAGGLDAMATSGQSATALLAQHGTLQTACGNASTARRT
jgi:hypothetical protein